ncbi:acetate/propionate family kinase [Haoranjiania flava]|uniref:Acetate kinase n=1 Tax=Haoranjiania flava TaxID=1856322 RepID=A0AAE3IKN2_9BACT|nr:acetate kinase [Haoranjiania flava]MCU7693483.1 acetate kinase [Haoranjiania flava]
MDILVINSGSSSIKYQLLNTETKEVLAVGLVERIGIDAGNIKHKAKINGEEKVKIIEQDIPNHEDAMKMVAELLTDKEVGVIHNPEEILAVGHRVVHGGESLVKTELINDDIIRKIEETIPLSPLHNPGHLAGIKVGMKIFSAAKHFAVLDTAFHQTMPPKAYRFAIPEKYYKEHHLRVYGFHGTSHRYVYETARDYLKKDDLKAITIHLGNGSSMSAVNSEGHCVDTSMGLTPLDGLMMGTRTGSIDASVVFYLGQVMGMDFEEIKTLFNKQSGMLGIAGSSDARDVTDMLEKGDANAQLCYDMYAYRIKKFIGSYTAVLNGVDALIFTAGLGEHDELMRSMACSELSYLGIEMDEEKNKSLNHAKQAVEIQSANSRVKILIIPTNEELQIAKEVYDLMQ